MHDSCIVTSLQQHGDVIPNSTTRGKIKDTEIETGTRYVKMVNVKGIIPSELEIGRYTVRTFCDNGKSACQHCDSTSHLRFACPNKPARKIRRCFKCDSPDHLAAECPGHPFCRNCGTTGHNYMECPDTSHNIRSEEFPAPISTRIKPRIRSFRGPDDVLSNYYKVRDKITYSGKEYPTVEHGYKTQKALYHERDDLIVQIENTENPGRVSRLVDEAIAADGKPNEEWLLQRTRIMKALLNSKVKKCQDFKQELINSEGKIIVEATSHPIWASGLPGHKQTLQCPPQQWPGQNKLGLLLMEIRDELLSEDKGEEQEAQTEETAEEVIDNYYHSTVLHKIDTTNNALNGILDTKETLPNTPKSIPENTISVVIGDSILINAQEPEGVKLVADRGATLTSIQPMIEKAKKKTKGAEVKNVVLALGINDITRTQSTGSTSALYTSAISKVKQHFPNSNIFISAVVPRRETNSAIKTSNEQIIEINNYLRDTAKLTDTGFIGNSNTFNKSLGEQYHDKKDPSGIHLNKQGQNKLMEIISDTLQKPDTGSKRSRSITTPSSAEKEQKNRRFSNASGITEGHSK